MKIIDSDELLKIFDKKCKHHCDDCGYFDNDFHCKLISDTPEVEPAKWQYEFFIKLFDKARPKGEWVDINGDGSLWKCTNCNEKSCCKGKFCPDCGADMRGDKND